MKSCVPLLLGAFLWTGPANAAIIYDNGRPDLRGAHTSDFDSHPDPPLQIADDFSFASSQTLRSVQWWGVTPTPLASDAFTLRIFPFQGGTLQAQPLHEYFMGNVPRTVFGSLGGTYTVYSYEAQVPDTVLAAGTYGLSIVNDTSNDLEDGWFWANSATDVGTAFARTREGMFWSPNVFESAFVISDVPEPSTIALAAVGLGLGALLRWSRRDASQVNLVRPFHGPYGSPCDRTQVSSRRNWHVSWSRGGIWD